MRLFEPPHALQLECGRALGPIDVAFETYGELNAQASNAVLVCHALSGDAHAAGYHSASDRKAGWWEQMIGPGKGIDTNQYFVISSNVLGGCSGTTGPSSINPATGEPWGLAFPVVTVEDMVKVQKRLVEHLGVTQLLAVVGGSMGGMQALEWAVRYPERVLAVVPLATTARQSAQSIAFDAVGRAAIQRDPGFNGGRYHAAGQPDGGLAVARMLAHITYLSEQSMHAKFGRELRSADHYAYDFGAEFSVETYLDHQGQSFVERFDANSYLYITKALDYYDLTRRSGSLAAALRDVQSRFLVISFSTDWLFTSQQSRDIVDALLANQKDVSYVDIDSPLGHDAFLLEPEILSRLIGGFLRGTPDHPDVVKRSAARGLPTVAAVAGPTPDEPQRWRRADYEQIAQWIKPRSAVLDLGCGDGGLLAYLSREREIDAMGVELDQDLLASAIERSLTLVQFDLEHDLRSFADKSWDFVVLSKTLQQLHRPSLVLREMLRIGRYAIVSFPNFAYWRRRWELIRTGCTPRGDEPEKAWHNSPNLRILSVRDFERYCREQEITILDRLFLSPAGRTRRWGSNLRAAEAVYLLKAR